MSVINTEDRVSAVERIVPRPPDDIAPLRMAFTRMVSKQWQIYVPPVLVDCGQEMTAAQFAKGRFIGEMYARACYSMLLVSQQGPTLLHTMVRAAALLPSRGMTIKLGSALLVGMEHLLPKGVHQQLLLMSALMGMLDVVLDDAASSGRPAALRVASLTARPCPQNLLQAEKNNRGLSGRGSANESGLARRLLGRRSAVSHPQVLRSRGSGSPRPTRSDRDGS